MVGNGPGLLKFFKPCRKNPCDLLLPYPNGLLSDKVDSSTTEEVNKEVITIVAGAGGKHKPYVKLTLEQKATIGRYMPQKMVL